MWSRLVRILLKALLCARASPEAASKQPLLPASWFSALRAGKHPKGDKLRKPKFLPLSYIESAQIKLTTCYILVLLKKLTWNLFS